MPRRRKQLIQYQGYLLRITSWEIGFNSFRANENPNNESLDIALDVTLSEPIKGVTAGQITLYGSTEQRGGYLQYDADKTLQGTVWIGMAGATNLVTMLAAEQQIILFLYGKPFRYRTAAIRDVCWYTENHPATEYLK